MENLSNIINSSAKNIAIEIELKEKITHLKAQLKVKESIENEKLKKLDLIKKSVMEELKESLVNKEFEKTNMSRLVAQLSCVLDDQDSIESLEDGAIQLNDAMFFDIDAMSNSLNEDDKLTVISNINAFKKVVENRVRVRNTVDGGRRFSFGALSDSSSKRKLSTENSRNVSQKIPLPTKIGSGRSLSRRNQTLSLNQFKNS